MKSLMYLGPGKLELIEEQIPEGDIVIKVIYSGICGTDLKTYLHGHHMFKPPVILGHECIGEITEINNKDSSFKTGDIVAVAPYIECNKCDNCKRGVPALCKDKTFLKTGCFCEYITVDIDQADKVLFKISSSEPVYTLVEPLACVLNGMSNLKENAQNYLIVGGGPMGALFSIALSSLGKKVSVVEPGMWRSEELKKITDAAIFSGITDISETYDGIILAVNIPELIEEYMPLVKDGGDMLLFSGYPNDKRAALDPFHIHYREVSVSGCTGFSSSYFKEALSMIKGYEDGFNKVITHFFDLQQAEDAFELFKSGNGMKVIIRM
ncbi:MAG: alcohol dehydrogenase catalytic domain-containing protein [Spirochaetales bacterium]|nr:alcohol dehydrogenase catalytic domain-containing protein [Spirochaetales bacterium]